MTNLSLRAPSKKEAYLNRLLSNNIVLQIIASFCLATLMGLTLFHYVEVIFFDGVFFISSIFLNGIALGGFLIAVSIIAERFILEMVREETNGYIFPEQSLSLWKQLCSLELISLVIFSAVSGILIYVSFWKIALIPVLCANAFTIKKIWEMFILIKIVREGGGAGLDEDDCK